VQRGTGSSKLDARRYGFVVSYLTLSFVYLGFASAVRKLARILSSEYAIVPVDSST
jgi:hypothetical protein